MTSRDWRRRELGLIASYLRELRQEARVTTSRVVRDVPSVPRGRRAARSASVHHATRRAAQRGG